MLPPLTPACWDTPKSARDLEAVGSPLPSQHSTAQHGTTVYCTAHHPPTPCMRLQLRCLWLSCRREVGYGAGPRQGCLSESGWCAMMQVVCLLMASTLQHTPLAHWHALMASKPPPPKAPRHPPLHTYRQTEHADTHSRVDACCCCCCCWLRYQGHVSAALVLGGVDLHGPHLFTVSHTHTQLNCCCCLSLSLLLLLLGEGLTLV